MNGLLHFAVAGPRTQSQADVRTSTSLQHVPALGLAAGQADLLRGIVVGMHLDRELVLGKDDFHQQRKTVASLGGGAIQIAIELVGQFPEGASGERTVGDSAVFAGKPNFADGFFADLMRWIKSREIVRAPDTLMKVRQQQ